MSKTLEVCFVLGNEEFQVAGLKLSRTSRYFEDLFKSSEDFTEVRLILPEWIKLRPFKVYLSYIETSRLPKLDLVIAQKLLWLGDFFKDEELQRTLINSHIIPYLNKETVLLFVQDTCTKISTSAEVSSCWLDLFHASCQYASEHLKYLLSETFSVFKKLDRLALKEIFERSAASPFFSEYLEKLQELKESKDLIELLAVLENESLVDFQQLASQQENLVFRWEIHDFEFGNFYKESESFKIGDVDWVLCIWCFEHEKRLEFSLKLAEVTKELKQKLSVITSVVLVQDETFDDVFPKIQPIPAYSPTSPIIREISSFQIDSVSKFSILFYASSEEVISGILNQIIKNPEILNRDAEKMPKSFILSVLNSKYLNIEHEDQALEIMAQWVEKQSSIEEDLLKSLNEAIFWEFVSMKELIFVTFNHQKFKMIQIFQNSIKKELENKGKKLGSKEYSEDTTGGRKSYKNHLIREQFNNQKEFISTIFDLVLNTQSLSKVSDTQETNENELSEKLQMAEKEIEMLKSVRNDVLSPIPQLKIPEEENSISFTPVNRTAQVKSRSSSNDGFFIKSVEGFLKNHPKKAGAVIGDLVQKLRTSRKNR